MDSIDTLATFFGWCTVINIGVLVFGGLAWAIVKEGISELAARMFGVSAEAVKATLFHVLMQYRAAILLLNLVPYVALRIVA